MNESRIGGCGWAGLIFLGLFAFSWIWSRLPDELVNGTTETVTLPSGEILSNRHWIVSGWQGSSSLNHLFYRTSSSSPREDLGIINHGKLPLDQARIVPYRGNLSLLVINEHIFEHSVSSKGKSSWIEISWMADSNASLFLDTFMNAVKPGNYFDGQPNINYWLDHVEPGQDLIVTRQHTPVPGLPIYLVYSDAFKAAALALGVNDANWQFDLERTRAMNGLKPPDNPKLSVEVAIVRCETSDIHWDPGHQNPDNLGSQKVYEGTLPVSTTDWHEIPYAIQSDPAAKLKKTQVTFLYGFDGPKSDEYTLCWRGADVYGTVFASTSLDKWTWVGNGYGPGAYLIYFRLHKIE